MDFPAVRLNAHALNVIFSARRSLCLHFWRCDPSVTKRHTCRPLLYRQNFNMRDGLYIHRSQHLYWKQVFN